MKKLVISIALGFTFLLSNCNAATLVKAINEILLVK